MARMHKCRKCGALLERSKQIVFSHFEDVLRIDKDGDRRIVPEPTYKHLPCPKCGDPKPLATIAANWGTLAFLAFVIAAIMGGGYFILFL
ncbi:hypothetical protein [Sphingomonas immobilis]|uniref:Uncharacterized protein n=1 Tax=Sphingomonas immobilis TaxID=3063997 RepID=A0ABT9A4E5_9SPHN|nr:hypothetical protein [Sphingomonas sp. CA1-15]MDO7844307.1 hypothetical protein [Sphingomonas sp. CA1-15]